MPNRYVFRGIWLSAVFFFTVLTGWGQDCKLNITILDSLSGEPLPYGNIYLKKAGRGAMSDAEGIAFISLANAEEGDSLIVSYVGYGTQTVPVACVGTKVLKIVLSPSPKSIPDVIISAGNIPKPEKLIMNAIKNTGDNYASQEVVLYALYRETIRENDRYVQLNEAVTRIFYSAYPQPDLDPRIWMDWYYDERYAFDLEGTQILRDLLLEYNTRRDQQQILASRCSRDLSTSGTDATLVCDPLQLTALDKIKYQYDFLDPRLVSDYRYTWEGMEHVNGSDCHVVSFYPRSLNGRFRIDLSEKTRDAIYTGRIYVEEGSFAVTKVEYRLAVNRDYGFFAGRMPLDYLVEVNYTKRDGKWGLESVRHTETVPGYAGKKEPSAILTASKELIILEEEREQPIPFADSTLFKSTRFSSVRYYRDHYNPDWWKTHVLPMKCALHPRISADMEQETTLEEQFQYNCNPVRENLPAPVPAKRPFAFQYHDTLMADSLHWMADLQYEDEFISYLKEENVYAKNLLLPDRRYQEILFQELNTFYPAQADTAQRQKPGSYFWDADSLGNEVIYLQEETGRATEVFNLGSFLNQHENTSLTRVLPQRGRNMVIVQYNKVGIFSDFAVVMPFGENTVLDSLSRVYSIAWNTDSSFVYTHTDPTGRSYGLFYHEVGADGSSMLYTEPDNTFDVAVEKQGDVLFCTIQSRSENEIYRINSATRIPVLELVVARLENVVNEIRVSGKWYLHARGAGNSIWSADAEFPLNWIAEAEPGRKDFILDYTVSKNYIITHVLHNSFQKIRYLKKGDQKWVEIPLPSEIHDLNIFPASQRSDTLTFSYSSPTGPGRIYQYDLNEGSLYVDRSEAVSYPAKMRSVFAKRLWARSGDGTPIPITLVREATAIRNHKGLILKVYGAFGANTTPSFSARDAILLHQGYTIAYAHVRGDNVMGAGWYEAGKLMQKKNSMEDYIACARHLIRRKITSPDYLVAYGNSAGGLVVGWAVNEYPALFKAAILDHPFLDVTNMMMHDSLPLTVDDYKEFGNPKKEAVFRYINSYSPCQNTRWQSYPNLIFLASYQDFQTPAWQVAKFVGLLRERNTGPHDIILLTDMNSGHSGNTTGKEWMKVFAQTYSFLNLCLFKNGSP